MRRVAVAGVLMLLLAGCAASPQGQLRTAVAEVTDAANVGDPASFTSRLETLLGLIEEQRGDELTDAKANTLRALALALQGDAGLLAPQPSVMPSPSSLAPPEQPPASSPLPSPTASPSPSPSPTASPSPSETQTPTPPPSTPPPSPSADPDDGPSPSGEPDDDDPPPKAAQDGEPAPIASGILPSSAPATEPPSSPTVEAVPSRTQVPA